MLKNTYRNFEQDRRLENVEKHIETINNELGSIKVDVAQIKGDVCFLKKTYWIIASATITSLIIILFDLLLKI